MPTYLMFSTLGPDGAATLLQHPERLEEVNREVEAMGVKVVQQWAILGPYDFCNVLEAPDQETMSRVALVLGARGTVKTLTMSAVPVETFVQQLRGGGS